MKSLFTEGELRALRRIDEELEQPPLSRSERMEAETRDKAIRREALGEQELALRPGQGLLTLPDGWFERARAERFSTTEEAARACSVSPVLMWRLECGGVTAPELARRIGRAMGLTRAGVRGITCAKTAMRRKREALERQEEARAAA